MSVHTPREGKGADGAMVPKAPLGSLSDGSNRREILLGDVPVKSLTARLRRRLVLTVEDTMIDSQHGAGLHAGSCPMAHLLLRAASDHAWQAKCSHAMLFVDIKSAFAGTIRELVLPPACDDEQRVRSIPERRGFPPAEAATIVAEGLHTQLLGATPARASTTS